MEKLTIIVCCELCVTVSVIKIQTCADTLSLLFYQSRKETNEQSICDNIRYQLV